MTNDELQALANKVTSDDDTSDNESEQFLEETDQVLKDILTEVEQNAPLSDDAGNGATSV